MSTLYTDLLVWQKAMDLVDEIYAIAKRLPKEELYALSDQMRRAAVSVPSNIAEGHKRNSNKDFKHFLSISNGSVAELETQLNIAIRQNMISKEDAEEALVLCDEVSRMLYSFIQRLDTPSLEL